MVIGNKPISYNRKQSGSLESAYSFVGKSPKYFHRLLLIVNRLHPRSYSGSLLQNDHSINNRNPSLTKLNPLVKTASTENSRV